MKKIVTILMFAFTCIFATACGVANVEDVDDVPVDRAVEEVIVQSDIVEEDNTTTTTAEEASTTVTHTAYVAGITSETVITVTETTTTPAYTGVVFEATPLVNEYDEYTDEAETETVVATTNTTTYVSYQTYEVISGDTWYGIALKYHVYTSDLLAVNNADEYTILQVGQNINIPDYGYYDESQEYYEETFEEYTSSYSSGTFLSSNTLYYSTPWNNSWYNICLSAQYLNGTVLYPGDTFSWFWYMGPCDYSQGYVDSTGYAGDQVVQTPGGGICFTSTNLHLAARSAGMEILERHDHSMPVGYAVRGDEASVDYGNWDLKFYNNTGATVVIYASTDDYGALTISFYTM